MRKLFLNSSRNWFFKNSYIWVSNILGISLVIYHLSFLLFFCCVGESENPPPPLGLAANTLLPDSVASTAAADPSNGI